MLLGFRSVYEKLRSRRLNTPTMRVPRRGLGTGPSNGANAVYGEGTVWPTAVVLSGAGAAAAYRVFDIGTAYTIRVIQWHVAIDITKTVTLTQPSSGDVWQYTAHIEIETSMPEKGMEGGGPVPNEKIFAQALFGFGPTIVNDRISPTTEFLQITGGTISGTYTPGAGGPPRPFSGVWDAINSNFVRLDTNGMEMFTNVANNQLTGVLSWGTFFSVANATMTWGTAVPAPDDGTDSYGIQLETDWAKGNLEDHEYDVSATIRIPAWDGSGSVEASTSMGFFLNPPPAGVVRTGFSVTGTIEFEPVKALSYAGVWNTATGAPLLNPLTAAIDGEIAV